MELWCDNANLVEAEKLLQASTLISYDISRKLWIPAHEETQWLL